MIGLRLVKIPSALFPECSIDGNMYARTYRRLFHEFNSEEAVKLYPNVVETLIAHQRYPGSGRCEHGKASVMQTG